MHVKSLIFLYIFVLYKRHFLTIRVELKNKVIKLKEKTKTFEKPNESEIILNRKNYYLLRKKSLLEKSKYSVNLYN